MQRREELFLLAGQNAVLGLSERASGYLSPTLYIL
jgi:hypothetical protein